MFFSRSWCASQLGNVVCSKTDTKINTQQFLDQILHVNLDINFLRIAAIGSDRSEGPLPALLCVELTQLRSFCEA